MNNGKIAAIAIFATLSFALLVSAPCFAEEGLGQKAKDTGKAAACGVTGLVAESVNVVGRTASSGAKVVTDTVKATGQTLSGEYDKAPDVVTTPVTGSAETVKDAAVGVVETPAKAARRAR